MLCQSRFKLSLRSNFGSPGPASLVCIQLIVNAQRSHTSKLREVLTRIRRLPHDLDVLITLFTGYLDLPRLFQRPPHDLPELAQNCLAQESLTQLPGEWDPSQVLKGPPTPKFRGNSLFLCRSRPLTIILKPDNLLDHLSYIASGANAGPSQSFVLGSIMC